MTTQRLTLHEASAFAPKLAGRGVTMVKVLRWANVVVTGVLGCGWLFSCYAVVPALRSFSGRTFIEVHQAIFRAVPTIFRVIFSSALATQALTLVLLRGKKAPLVTWVLSILGLASTVVCLTITVRVNVPINEEVATWTPESLPSDWADIRSKFFRFNYVRTGIALGGFLLQTAAALTDKRT